MNTFLAWGWTVLALVEAIALGVDFCISPAKDIQSTALKLAASILFVAAYWIVKK